MKMETLYVSSKSGRSNATLCEFIIGGGTHSAPAASEAILGKRRIDGNSLATMITPKLLVK